LKILILHHTPPFPFIAAFLTLHSFSLRAQQYTLLVASLAFFVFTLVLLTVLLSPMQTAYAAELEYRTAQVQLAQPVPATGEQMRKSQVCRRVWALLSKHERETSITLCINWHCFDLTRFSSCFHSSTPPPLSIFYLFSTFCCARTHTPIHSYTRAQTESTAMAASFPPLSRMRPLPPIHRDVFVGLVIFNLFGVVRQRCAIIHVSHCHRGSVAHIPLPSTHTSHALLLSLFTPTLPTIRPTP
jgi:hypothetical protein